MCFGCLLSSNGKHPKDPWGRGGGDQRTAVLRDRVFRLGRVGDRDLLCHHGILLIKNIWVGLVFMSCVSECATQSLLLGGFRGS